MNRRRYDDDVDDADTYEDVVHVHVHVDSVHQKRSKLLIFFLKYILLPSSVGICVQGN